MYQISKCQGHSLHLHVVLLTVLALAIVYTIEATRQPPVEAASSLEPTFSHPGGHYDQDIRLTISAPIPDAYVLFTVDGSVPTDTTGTIYTRPICLDASTPAVTVVRARAVLPDGTLGPVVNASYFIAMRATLPMISLIIEPSDLWDPETGIIANPLAKGAEWERPADVTYVDDDRHSGFHIAAGVRIHGGATREVDKKQLRLYFRQEYGASRLEYPLFDDSEVQSFKRLLLHSGGQDWSASSWNWTLMRNQLVDALTLELDGYATHSQPALLFINGEPWGIYLIRERIERRFLADHYGIESADLLDSPEHSWDSVTLMGDRKHWNHLMKFVETHGLADPSNYAYVQSQIDIDNYIDYNLLQIYIGNYDWPYHNVLQFRSRVQGGNWHWMMWDSDSSFAAVRKLQPPELDIVTRLLDRDFLWTTGRDIRMFGKLLENQVFRDRFLSRAADLLNTAFTPQSVVAHIDALAAELEPDIAYETMRWPNSAAWTSNVEVLRDFARLRPDLVRRHITERLGLNGTSQITFAPPDDGSGHVAVNGTFLQDLPWQGIYFQGVPIQITAVPAPGYRFAGWDPSTLPQTPTLTLTANTTQTITPRFTATGRNELRPGDVIFTGYHMDGDSHITGSWFELQVMRPGGVDLRGWRVTDNDTKTATDEGSLVFADNPAFARVPRGTTIVVIVNHADNAQLPEDDVDTWDRRVVLYAGNRNLDAGADPGFNLGPKDNLVLLAPGPTGAFDDDQGIAFVADGTAVTPASFGVLGDGVIPDQ